MPTGAIFEKVEKLKMIHRILILVGTIVLLAGIFVALVYIPKSKEITRLNKEIAGLEKKINQAKIKARTLKKFEAEQVEVEAQFGEALKLLPNEREIPTLLRSITQLGSDANLEFRLFSPNKEKARDFYIEIPVSMEVSGTYHDVATFFDKVGRMKRIVNILDISMKPVKERSTNLTTKCDAVTYRFKREVDEKTEAGKNKKKKK
ncbi:MAG: type 4a pilus biogenesis protein PilO [Desulfobulbaceae bacterium]|jgi:type IV pilus assembly protein PilO|nr:type 4a pilus biogenesis protein PilO [Desulfobulbaceae bacterium]